MAWTSSSLFPAPTHPTTYPTQPNPTQLMNQPSGRQPGAVQTQLVSVAALAATESAFLALRADGALVAWGGGFEGELAPAGGAGWREPTNRWLPLTFPRTPSQERVPILGGGRRECRVGLRRHECRRQAPPARCAPPAGPSAHCCRAAPWPPGATRTLGVARRWCRRYVGSWLCKGFLFPILVRGKSSVRLV